MILGFINQKLWAKNSRTHLCHILNDTRIAIHHNIIFEFDTYNRGTRLTCTDQSVGDVGGKELRPAWFWKELNIDESTRRHLGLVNIDTNITVTNTNINTIPTVLRNKQVLLMVSKKKISICTIYEKSGNAYLFSLYCLCQLDIPNVIMLNN